MNFTGTAASLSSAFGDWQLASMQVLFKPTFNAIIASLTGLDPNSLIWTGDPNPFVSPVDAAIIKMRVRKMGRIGHDERRSDGIAGVREVCITFRCEAYDLSVEASEFLNRILTGMYREDINDALVAIGLAYQHSEDAQFVGYIADNREVNVAQQDFYFNGITNLLFAPGSGFIQTVDGDNNVSGVVQ
jgi:hypothetical protein